MAKTKIIKVLSVIGGLASGGAVLYEEVVEPIINPTEVQVVEEYNYEYQHIINITDTYFINGEEVSAEDFANAKTSVSHITTTTEDMKVSVIDESAFNIYYGAVDTLPTTLSGLSVSSYEITPASFSINIKAGNIDTEEGQYAVVAIPNSVKVESWQSSGFSLEVENYSIGNYTLYYLTSRSYDEDLGGIDYVIYFTK